MGGQTPIHVPCPCSNYQRSTGWATGQRQQKKKTLPSWTLKVSREIEKMLIRLFSVSPSISSALMGSSGFLVLPWQPAGISAASVPPPICHRSHRSISGPLKSHCEESLSFGGMGYDKRSGLMMRLDVQRGTRRIRSLFKNGACSTVHVPQSYSVTCNERWARETKV